MKMKLTQLKDAYVRLKNMFVRMSGYTLSRLFVDGIVDWPACAHSRFMCYYVPKLVEIGGP